jgi:hypothetical protein
LFIRPDSALNHYAVIFKESVIVSGIWMERVKWKQYFVVLWGKLFRFYNNNLINIIYNI